MDELTDGLDDLTIATPESSIEFWRALPAQTAPPLPRIAPAPLSSTLYGQPELPRISNAQNEQTIYVIYGPGGTGKTQLALRFAASQNDRFTSSFILDASSTHTLNSSLHSIAHHVAGMEGLPSSSAVPALIETFGDQPNHYLLIFDGADDSSLNLASFLPKCAQATIIVTTRNPDFTTLASSPQTVIKCTPLSPEDAQSLILSALPSPTEGDSSLALKVAERLSFLPLAHSLSKSFLTTASSMTLESYLEHLIILSEDILSSLPDIEPHKFAMFLVCEMTHEYFESLDGQEWKVAKAAVELLSVSGFLHKDGLGEVIFKKAFEKGYPFFQPDEEGEGEDWLDEFFSRFKSEEDTWDSAAFKAAIDLLVSYGLVTVDDESGSFAIPGLVQAWLRAPMDEVIRARYWSAALKILASSISSFSIEEEEGEAEYERSLLPHILQFDDSKVLSSPDGLNAATKFAGIYIRAGLTSEAKLLLFRVTESSKEIYDDSHPTTLVAQGNMGLFYLEQGQVEEASVILEHVVTGIQEVMMSSGSQQTLSDMLMGLKHLAKVHTSLGQWREAESYLQLELSGSEISRGPDHPDVILAQTNLGLIYVKLAKYDLASKIQLSALVTSKQVYGEKHPDTWRAMNNLALTYFEIGRYEAAESLQTEVWEGMRELLGVEHPVVMMSCNNLALTLAKQGKAAEAVELQELVLATTKENFGESHPEVLRAMAGLASSYYELERFGEAVELQEVVFEARQEVLGKEHPDTLVAMSNYALTLRALGSLDEAAFLQHEELELTKAALGAEHPSTLTSMGNLALTLSAQEDFSGAQKLQSSELEIRKNILGPKHPSTLTTMHNLAATLLELGKEEEAEEMLRVAVEGKEEQLGVGHPSWVSSVEVLVAVLKKRGKEAEVEEWTAKLRREAEE